MLWPLRLIGIVCALIVCAPLHYLWILLRRSSPWPRLFLGAVARIAGMRPVVVGQPLEAHVLFLANHLSWLDILLIAGATGSRFVSKAEVARWPVVGWLASLNDTIFVARTERSAVKGQADAVRVALADGRPVGLFPEGTTAGGTEVLPFRASLLAALYPPLRQVRVQPVAIDYGAAATAIAWVGDEPAPANARRVLSRRGRTRVTLHFLEPLDPADYPDRKALGEAVRGRIVAALFPSAQRPERV